MTLNRSVLSRLSTSSTRRLGTVVALALLALSVAVAQEADRWQPAMDRFAELDRQTPPTPGGVLFLGSSSIRMWDLERWLPSSGAVNRGFGGSEIADSIRHFDTLVAPHAPRAIFFYAGDNDVARGKSAEVVAADFSKFRALVAQRLPRAHVYYVAIKPSLSRWTLWPEMARANASIAKAAKTDPLLSFVDVASPMIDSSGEPVASLFIEDGLHMNDAGYQIWSDIVAPLVIN
ncbi:MAG: GDSL-type esterase/lipase family protein [Acidobacteriota bacterium]|nr:GDSL-type esterase/lipase family protein [Acidobacteriota bacterium]